MQPWSPSHLLASFSCMFGGGGYFCSIEKIVSVCFHGFQGGFGQSCLIDQWLLSPVSNDMIPIQTREAVMPIAGSLCCLAKKIALVLMPFYLISLPCKPVVDVFGFIFKKYPNLPPPPGHSLSVISPHHVLLFGGWSSTQNVKSNNTYLFDTQRVGGPCLCERSL